MQMNSSKKQFFYDFILAPLLAFGLLSLVFWQTGKWYRSLLLQNQRSQVEANLLPYSQALTAELHAQLALIEGLAAFANSHTDLASLQLYFPAYAEGLYLSAAGVRSVQIFPPEMDHLIYPSASNQEVVGRNLNDLLHNEQAEVYTAVQRALRTHQSTICGPYELRQEGLGLMMLQAIYKDDSLWGMAIIITDVPKILARAGLNQPTPGLRLAIKTGSQSILFGDEQVFSDSPVTFSIALPGGVWELSATPKNGWDEAILMEWNVFLIVSWLIISLLVFIAYLLRSCQARLRIAVDQHSSALAMQLEEKRKSEEENRKLNRVYAVLSEINEAIVRIRELPLLLNKSCEIMVEKGDFDLAWVGLLSPATQKLKPVAAAGKVGAYLDQIDIGLAQSSQKSCPIDRALREGQRVICAIDQVCDKNLKCHFHIHEARIGSVGVFPLKVYDQLRGVLALYARETDHFNEFELALLDDLAKDISFAIQIAEQEEQRLWAEADMLQSNRLYQVLSQVNQLVLRAETPEELFCNVCQIAVEHGNFKLAWVAWLDDDKKILRPVAIAGDGHGFFNNLVIPCDDPTGASGPLTTAIQAGEPYISIDFDQTTWMEIAAAAGFEAMGSFPLRLEGNLVGALNIHVDHRDYFRIKEIKLLQEVADDISFALDHQRKEALRRQAEAAIQEQYRLLKALINSPVDISIFSLDRNYCYTTFNENHRRQMMQLWNAQIEIGMNILDLVANSKFRQLAKARLDRALAGEAFTEIQHQPGLDIYYEFNWNPIRRPDGEVDGLTAFVMDISQRKRAEVALQRYAERLRNLHKIDQAILEAIDSPEAIAQTALKSIHNLLSCQRTSIFVHDRETQQAFIYTAESSAQSISSRSVTLPESEREIAETLRLEPMQIVEDVSAAEQALPLQSLLTPDDSQAYINIPLISGDRPIGILNLAWTEAHRFTAEEIEIAKEIANQIAIAVEQARLRKATTAYANELEQRVAERTAQLEISNKELEAFAYSVSHDLRAPLRAIDGFTRILYKEYHQKLDEEGNRLLGIIRESTDLMDRLITDILALSRVSRAQLRFIPIDMTYLVKMVYRDLAIGEEYDKYDFQVSDLPHAKGDPTLLRQVWSNLISNAIKYSMPKDQPRIEISGYEKDGICTYMIQDNGVGFDPRYSDKLFTPFQRLHKASEFEGTGIGLAIVQRIVHRHGGQVWAEGRLNEGATFTFTIPLKETDNETNGSRGVFPGGKQP